MTEQRLIDLEMKFSHQEAALEALHVSVYEQQKAIERLEGRLNGLSKRLAGMSDGGPEIGPADEKPPHY